MIKSKGMTVSSLQAAGLSLVVLAVVIGIGAQILGTIQDQQTENSTEYNTSAAGLDALGEFADWFTIIVIVLIAVVIIALLVRGLGGMASSA